MNKKDRLEILLEAKQIGQKTFLKIKKIADQLKNCSDKKWSFLVHAAIALNRIQEGIKVDELDDVVILQLKNHQLFNEAQKQFKLWFDDDIPTSEKLYLFIHILNYLEGKWK